MATIILGGRTAKKTPRLEITVVERSDGTKVGAGQQRKDHSYKQGLPVRSLPQFEVFITETLTLLADMEGKMERTDLRSTGDGRPTRPSSTSGARRRSRCRRRRRSSRRRSRPAVARSCARPRQHTLFSDGVMWEREALQWG